MRWSRTTLALLCCALPAAAGLQEQESQDSTGNTALIDLGTGTYQGFEGGLYPGGVNTPP